MGEPHVISALVSKHSELAGEIRRREAEITKLRNDIAHIEAALRLCGYTGQTEDIKPVVKRRKVGAWLRRGALRGHLFDLLRDAPEPLAASDMARTIMQAHGIPTDSKKDFEPFRLKTVAMLRYLRGRGLVEQVGEGRATAWRVAEEAP